MESPTMWALSIFSASSTARMSARAILRITLVIRWHVRRRITPRVVGDAPIAAGKIANLRFPRTIVSGEFMHEDDRNARPAVLVVELHVVIGAQMRHRCSLFSKLRHIGHAVSDGSWDACPSNCYSVLGLED